MGYVYGEVARRKAEWLTASITLFNLYRGEEINEPIMITIPLDEYRFLLEMKIRNENHMFQHNELMSRINNLEQSIINMINNKK